MPSGIGQTHLMVCRITSPAYRVGGVRALASPELAVRRKVGCSLNNDWTSHLGGAGEPSGATRRPRGRPCGGRRSAPTAMDGSDDDPQGGKGVKSNMKKCAETPETSKKKPRQEKPNAPCPWPTCGRLGNANAQTEAANREPNGTAK